MKLASVLALWLGIVAIDAGAVTSGERGQAWIAAHPFQIGAFIEAAPPLAAYRECGFNVQVNIYAPTGNKVSDRLLQTASASGLPWYIFYRWLPKHDDRQFLETFARQRQQYPGNIGLMIGDENPEVDFPRLGQVLDSARKIAPDAVIFHCAKGLDMPGFTNPGTYEKYVDKLIAEVRPDVVVFDMYPFYNQNGNHGLAVNFYRNLEEVTAKARKAGIPCFNWLQAFAFQETDKWPHHAPSESELRMQGFVSLAYGMKGLFYWTYDSQYFPYGAAIVDRNGRPTEIGRLLPPIVQELRTIGAVVKDFRDFGAFYVPARTVGSDGKVHKLVPYMVKTFSPGKVPALLDAKVSDGVWGFLVGDFRDKSDTEYIMVVNTAFGYRQSAAETAGTVNLRFADDVKSLARLDRLTGRFEPLELKNGRLENYRLPGGTGDLFRINR